MVLFGTSQWKIPRKRQGQFNLVKLMIPFMFGALCFGLLAREQRALQLLQPNGFLVT